MIKKLPPMYIFHKIFTVNIEEFPDSNEATVDFPTPLPPTIETKDNCVSNSGILGSSRNL